MMFAKPKKPTQSEELDDFEFTLLTAVAALTPEATTTNVIRFVYEMMGQVLDVAQVHLALKRFESETAWIRMIGTKSLSGRQYTLYGLSEKGRRLLIKRGGQLTKLSIFYAAAMEIRG